MKLFRIATLILCAPVTALLACSGSGPAREGSLREAQALWRTCSPCHCVPDGQVPEDRDWLRLNETTTCITGEMDTPKGRKALIDYLQLAETIRPVLIDGAHEPPSGTDRGKIRVPSTPGSAYLKAERESVRAGAPPKIRLHWEASEKGRTLALPAGEYRVISYSFYRTDGDGKRWCLSGSSAEGCALLKIGGDEEAAFALRPELQGHLGAKEEAGGGRLEFFMTNLGGIRMSISRDGKLVHPKWRITDAEGKTVAQGRFGVT